MSKGVLNIQDVSQVHRGRALLSMLYMSHFIGKAKHILRQMWSIDLIKGFSADVCMYNLKAALLIVASL